MTELVSGMRSPQFGANLRDCEDRSWFKVKDVSYDIFAYPRRYAYTMLMATSLNQEGCNGKKARDIHGGNKGFTPYITLVGKLKRKRLHGIFVSIKMNLKGKTGGNISAQNIL
jgi:hypothetical protein